MRKLPGKIAAINDLAGYGRCSLAVMLPAISACGYQCCPVPTAVLSTSNDFCLPFVHELTHELPGYIEHWEQLGLGFNGIYSGYLSSADQISSVLRFLSSFRTKDTVLLVDPVLGDQGRISPRCSKELMSQYKLLIQQADIITPNLTEALYLAGKPYEACPAEETIDAAAQTLLSAGPGNVIITGIKKDALCCTYLYEPHEKHIIFTPYCPQERTGAGDLFASILLSKYLDGFSLKDAAEKASVFLSTVLQYTYEQKVPRNQGICFEPFLNLLSPYGNPHSLNVKEASACETL